MPGVASESPVWHTFVGAAVDDAGTAAGVGDETELRHRHDVVAPALADDLLAAEGTVDLDGADVGDLEVQHPVDGADGFGSRRERLVGICGLEDTSCPAVDRCGVSGVRHLGDARTHPARAGTGEASEPVGHRAKVPEQQRSPAR